MSHGLEKLLQDRSKPEVFYEGIRQTPADKILAASESAKWEARQNRSSRDKLTETHEQLCRRALDLMLKKNQDYACESDLFRNFRYFGPLGVLVRLSDKLSRLRTFEERNTFSVTDESLRDTIEDAINYLVIYYCMKTEAK